jgi:Domain of unknown function (DUF6089)
MKQQFSLFFLLFIPCFIHAQQIVEMGLFSGFANYQGDLSESSIQLGETKLGYGGFLRLHYEDKFKVRANAFYGLISGSDANAKGSLKDRGWSFKANVLEAGIEGEYHPFGRSRAGNTGIFRAQLSPYIATGLGFAIADAKLTVPSQDAGLFPEQDDTGFFIVVPLVAGVRFDFHENFSLGAEWGWRATFSDYLDGVAKNGNDTKGDWYLFVGGTISYFFGTFKSFDFENNDY